MSTDLRPRRIGASQWVVLCAPALIAALLFSRTIAFSFVHYDDPNYVTNNPLVKQPLASGWTELVRTRSWGYPSPVTLLTYVFGEKILGRGPAAAHGINVLLHTIAVLLLTLLARRLGLSPHACAIAGLLLAVHPLVVEPVAWVSGRKDLLAALFTLGAACLLTRARSREEAPPTGMIAAMLILAVLSKPSAISAAPLLLLLDRVFGGKLARRALGWFLPSFTVGVVVVAIGFEQQRTVGALVENRSYTQVASDAARAWTLQLQHLLVAVDLMPFYVRSANEPSTGQVLGAVLSLLGAATLFVWALKEDMRVVSLGVAWVVLTYFPTSGFAPLSRWSADSYFYLPLCGLALALGDGVDRWQRSREATLIAAVLALLLACLSVAQMEIWRSGSSLFERAVLRYPDHPVPLAFQAVGLRHDGQLVRADQTFRQLERQFPTYTEFLTDHAELLARLGQTAAAESRYVRAARANEAGAHEAYVRFLLIRREEPAPEYRDVAQRSLETVAPDVLAHGTAPVIERAEALARALGELELAEQFRKARRTVP